jgi:hypothetical protein
LPFLLKLWNVQRHDSRSSALVGKTILIGWPPIPKGTWEIGPATPPFQETIEENLPLPSGIERLFPRR